MIARNLTNYLAQRNIAADGVYTYDLGVQPLSVLLINLRPLNDTATLATWANAYRICQAINRLTIYDRGHAVQSMRGEDIAALNFFRWGFTPFLANADDTNNERRVVTLPVIMGRYPYSLTSCYPARGKGELQVELDLDVADTGYDTLDISIDAIELPGAKVKEYERRLTQSMTFNATGAQDMDLPVGNLLRGLFLWGTTGYGGAAPAPSWGNVSVLLDNQEAGIRGIDWEVSQMLQALSGRPCLPPSEDNHLHRVTADGNAQTELTTLGGGGHGPTTPSEYFLYSLLDFDPTGDDAFALDTSAAKRLQIRAIAETADAVRCVSIERLTA
jgi:hypothetical protein